MMCPCLYICLIKPYSKPIKKIKKNKQNKIVFEKEKKKARFQNYALIQHSMDRMIFFLQTIHTLVPYYIII